MLLRGNLITYSVGEENSVCGKRKNYLKFVLLNVYNFVRMEVLYNIDTEYVMPMKLVRLMKMYLNETCGSNRADNRLPGTFLMHDWLKL
jgi:hypothetical protein